ncbi:hypothetical protein EPA93_25675 [Ktedonosporobacter rubrisoli]|uniref:Uncharacterized protein n=1 Tax=Ktedonosporobacter rubrisoli TaxID=2509675 RepID=A0A4P6JUX3_KTERU|nr:hypothetical protein [Ktedonosporobacter rubrisoli]QBD79185.1 hypothetical protein EPA93_25675 [Ktedonosporobacter rubrisoli]
MQSCRVSGWIAIVLMLGGGLLGLGLDFLWVGFFPLLLVLIGLSGLYTQQRTQLSRMMHISIVLIMLGIILDIIERILFRVLPFDVVVFFLSYDPPHNYAALWTFAVIRFPQIIGMTLLGIQVYRTRFLPGWCAIWLVVGGLSYLVLLVFLCIGGMITASSSGILVLLFGASWVSLGIALHKTRKQEPVVLTPSEIVAESEG